MIGVRMKKFSKGAVAKDRGQWKAVISYQENGTRHRLTKRTGIRCYPSETDMRGKQNAERVLHQWRDELIAEDAKSSPIITSDAPLLEFCKRYAEAKKYLVKDATYLGYMCEIRRLETTPLATMPIGEITPEIIRMHESSLAQRGLAGSTLKHHHSFLASVFKEAVVNRKIPYSPIASIRSPKARARPINSLTEEGRDEVLSLLQKRIPDDFSTAVFIALATGMRRGEICALRWTDIDFRSKMISVNYSYSKDMRGGYVMTSPKDPGGSDSKRTIPIGDNLIVVLTLRSKAMRDARNMLGLPWKPTLYVVGNPMTEKPYSPDMISRDWRAFVQSNAIYGSQAVHPVFHDLRHTFATLAIRSKAIDVKALAGILGHKDASMTLNVYADGLEDSKRSGMDSLDAAFGRIPLLEQTNTDGSVVVS